MKEQTVPAAVPQLMVDDRMVRERDGVIRRLGQPRKLADPIIRADRPWEGVGVLIWGSVIWDPADNRFRIWYEAYNPITSNRSNETLLCYAESADGIEWIKPSLGIIEYAGSTDNNIVYRSPDRFDTATVVIDPFDAAEAERFKMVNFDFGRRCFIRFASPDGVHWTELGEIELPIEAGDRHSMMVDEVAGRWRIYCKQHGSMRTIHQASSADFVHWDYHGEQLVPDDHDPPETQFYGMVGFRDGAPGLGFLEVFDILERRLHGELVVLDDDGAPSRPFQGQRFLGPGAVGDWDSAWAFPGNNPPIRFGEEHRIYYQGRKTLHWASPKHGGRGHIAAIGLATLRPHGWAGLEAQGATPGTILTEPFTLDGGILCVNANAGSEGGEVRIALCDATGTPLTGYGYDDCYPIRNDVTYRKLSWNGSSDLSAFTGKRVSLRFRLRKATLYSFWSSDRDY